ncbi:MAG: PadR family transcriptional regulator [Myxococcota bacterium]
MATANRTHFAVLGFLTLGPMSGYDIRKLVAQSTENFWSESFGQIYPALRRLEAERLIDKQVTASQGGRPRHVYTLNDRGRRALAAWLREPTEPGPVRIELLLKLFFGARCERETTRRQILDYRDRVANDLERYRSITERLHRERADAADLPYWLLTLRFGECDCAAHLAWCDEALEILEALPEPASETPTEETAPCRESIPTGT